jgi:hypothetical protein
MIAHRLDDGRVLATARRDRLGDMPAQQIAHEADAEPGDKWNAPAPRFQSFGGHDRRQRGADAGAKQQAEDGADTGQAPMKPRRPSGARSIKNTIELGYSPPSESPCIMRRSVSAMGANTPMVSYAGSTPIRKVGTAMAVIEATSAVRLPK